MAKLILLHGFPGAGKSTQAERLAMKPFQGHLVVHASAGVRLREIRTGQASSVHEALVRDPATPLPLDNAIVNDALFELFPADQPEALGIIDGYPRHASAVDEFIRAAHARGHRLIGCICLELSAETSLSRVVDRGVREGERLYGNTLEDYN